MAREGQYGERRRRLQAPAAPDSVAAWMQRYLEAMAVLGYSEAAQRARRQNLAAFLAWCEERGIARPNEITKPILERYQRHLFYLRKVNGEPLSLRGQALALTNLRSWFRWLAKHNHLLYNPASDLERPKAPRMVLPEALGAAEIEAVLSQPDVDDVQGLRDRALLELLYSTGLRRQEAADLSVFDVDFGRGVLRVRQGKGKKDRVVPIGERALAWLRKYLDDSRPQLTTDPHELALFLNRFGQRFGGNGLGTMVRAYLKQTGIKQRGACHLFRHTMATLMLANGADIRFIQEILGHDRLETTQLYTHVSIGQLKAVHAATHPAAKLARRTENAAPEHDAQDRDDDASTD